MHATRPLIQTHMVVLLCAHHSVPALSKKAHMLIEGIDAPRLSQVCAAECEEGNGSSCGFTCPEPAATVCQGGQCDCACPNPEDKFSCSENGCDCFGTAR